MPVRAQKTPQPSSARLLDVQFKSLQKSAPSHRLLLSEVVDRVRSEFVEMRGFSPTVDQAARLFQLNRADCDSILKGLVDEGFLRQTPDGRFRLPSQQ
jgi:hypothetical protein